MIVFTLTLKCLLAVEATIFYAAMKGSLMHLKFLTHSVRTLTLKMFTLKMTQTIFVSSLVIVKHFLIRHLKVSSLCFLHSTISWTLVGTLLWVASYLLLFKMMRLSKQN